MTPRGHTHIVPVDLGGRKWSYHPEAEPKSIKLGAVVAAVLTGDCGSRSPAGQWGALLRSR